MVVNASPLKRMKRRITADLYDFLSFPAATDEFSGQFDGPFRSNIKSFLTKHAQFSPPASLFPHLLIYQIFFRIGDLTDGPDSSPAILTLDIIEQDVTKSRSVYCDQCRVVGWSGHPVCGKRYHFIIRATDGYNKPCSSCGDLLQLPDSRCKSCNYVLTSDDVEEWVSLQLEDTTNLLHGVVHSNGYGHLLRVNGREGGSKYVSGSDIMNFWDRLCSTIRVRKISVMDVSKKHGMEYRLLHAVTNGHPWYGDWGYEFGTGSFALTFDTYQKAIQNLSEIPLSVFFSHSRNPRSQLQNVISLYRSVSEFELLTIKDLFCFLTRLIRDTRHSSAAVNPSKKLKTSSLTLCTWKKDDIDRVEETIIKVLGAVSEGIWVSWRSLKGASNKVASPELLDYCLKEMGGKLVDGGVVCARHNPETNTLEYRLKHSKDDNADDMKSGSSMACLRKEHLLRDLKFLYDSLLDPRTAYKPRSTWEAVNSASKLLDCKKFVKDYKPEQIQQDNPLTVRLLCKVEIIDHPQKDYTSPPAELILVPSNASLSDIKYEATKAFQEVYVLFRRFQAEDVLDLYFRNGVPTVASKENSVGSYPTIRVRGRFLGKQVLNRFKMERGTENWTVNCACGATDDDGERMLACDGCGVWQHTRCAGIHDFDAVPEKFRCWKCRARCSRPRVKVGTERKRPTVIGLLKSDNCKNDGVMVENSDVTGNNLNVASVVR